MLAQDERLARIVGGVVLLLMALGIVFFVFIAGNIDWGARVRIQAFFRHTGELKEGAQVMVAGHTIGTVESIAPSPRGAPGTPLDGEEGVAVTLDLSAAYAGRIARGGDFFVAGSTPLSARHLEIGPSPTPEGPTLADDHRPLRGSDPPTIDRVVQRTWENLLDAKRFVDEVAPEFRALRTELTKLAVTLDDLSPNIVGVASLGYELDGLVTEAKKLREALGGDRGLAALDTMLGRARTTITQARRMLDTLDAKSSTLATAIDGLRARLGDKGSAAVQAVELAITRLRAAIDKIDPLLAKIEDLNARIARGEGTIGRLARDPEFPEDAKELGKILKRHPWRIFMRPRD